MKTTYVIKIVCLVLTIVLLTGVLVYFLDGSESFIGLPILTTYDDASKYTIGPGIFDADDVNSVEINWVSGNIEIKKGNGNKISVYEENVESLNEDKRMRYYLDVSTLKVQFSSSKWLSGISLGNINKKKLYVLVPDSKSFKNFDIDQVSSDLSMSGISAMDIEIDNVSGKVFLDNVTASKFDFDTVSGDLNASGSFKKIDCDSTSANIDITSDVCPQDVNCDTISGSVKLYIPENDGFSVEFNSVSGKLTSDFAMKSIEKELFIYKNSVNEFEFDTVSGDVKILQR